MDLGGQQVLDARAEKFQRLPLNVPKLGSTVWQKTCCCFGYWNKLLKYTKANQEYQRTNWRAVANQHRFYTKTEEKYTDPYQLISEIAWFSPINHKHSHVSKISWKFSFKILGFQSDLRRNSGFKALGPEKKSEPQQYKLRVCCQKTTTDWVRLWQATCQQRSFIY